MGTIKTYKCSVCGNTWERAEGRGFFTANYYCDKCGRLRSKDIESDDLPSELGSCECGGTFRYEADTVVCPECKGINSAKEGEDIALWD